MFKEWKPLLDFSPVSIAAIGTAKKGHSCVRPQLSDGSINRGQSMDIRAAADLKHSAYLFPIWQDMK